MTSDAFTINNLKITFGQHDILTIDHLIIEQGKIYSVIGPSGAGKSTLMKVLNLIQKPTEGQISFLGQSVAFGNTNLLDARRSMAMVFQKPILFSGDVFYNVALGLKIRKTSSKETKKLVYEALEMVGLSPLASQQARTLSGGEAQKVALARAIVTKPKVLLLDEATANLDPANVAAIETIIKKLYSITGITIIMVTHNLNQAKRLSHETIFINKGQVVEVNSTEKIFSKPSHPETVKFVSGEMIY